MKRYSPVVTIEKDYDGNVIVTETRNGRIYERPMGWRWVVIVDGVVIQDFDLRREAEHFVTNHYGIASVPKRRRKS